MLRILDYFCVETKWKNNIHNSNYKEKEVERDDEEEDSGGDAFWQDAVFCLMSTSSSSKLLCMF